MNNTLRYLALALLVSVNLNAFQVVKAPVVTEVVETPVVSEDDSSDSDSKGGFVSGVIAKTSEIASSGVAGIETFVTTYPKAIAGTATVATVVAVYALIKWKKSADKVAELEDELEEVNALTA